LKIVRRTTRRDPRACVPFLFRQKQETNEKRPSTIIGQQAGEAQYLERPRCSSADTSDNTQIYGGGTPVRSPHPISGLLALPDV